MASKQLGPKARGMSVLIDDYFNQEDDEDGTPMTSINGSYDSERDITLLSDFALSPVPSPRSFDDSQSSHSRENTADRIAKREYKVECHLDFLPNISSLYRFTMHRQIDWIRSDTIK